MEIGERILNDINIAFDNDDSIDELGFVMDKEPSIICIEHKLGMSLGSLKPLFIYCSHKLNELMKLGIPLIVESDKGNDNNIVFLSQITRGLLLVRGDYPPAFAYRKMMISIGKISIDVELNFLKMLFAQHPKSPSSWQHRRWCLVTKANKNLEILSAEDMKVELSLCSASAESYPKNYYAWMHRLWLLQYMDVTCLKNELEFCDSWLLAHVSDHSAVSHKQQTLQRLLQLTKNNEEILTLLVVELSKNENSILSRPGNEALWYDRRGIMKLLLNEIKKMNLNRWNLLYTKRITQFVNDFNRCQEIRLNESINCNSIETSIDNVSNIIMETWGRNPDFASNYCNLYNSTTGNTKAALETLRLLMTDDDDKISLGSFVLLWIQSEVLLCRNCSEDGNTIIDYYLNTTNNYFSENAWNYNKQRQQSLRYISFLYYNVIILCNTKIDEANNATEFNDNTSFMKVQRLSELSQSISSKEVNSLLSIIIKGLKGIYYYYYYINIKIKINCDNSDNNTIAS